MGRGLKCAVVATAVGVMIFVAACGGGDDPADVTKEFVEAGLAADGEKVCDLLSAEVLEPLEAADTTCVETLGESPEASDEDKEKAATATYETTEESEDAATVEVTAEGEGTEAIELVKEDGEWKISALP